MTRLIALLTALLLLPATASAHVTPFLSVARARHALAEPDSTLSECRHARRNTVTCTVEYEGVFNVEPGEGDHQRVPVWAVLCGKRVYTLVTLGPVPTCREAIETAHDHLAGA